MDGALRVGDKLPGLFPSIFTPEERGQVPPDGRSSSFDRKIPVQAVVEYIHPEGRYFTARFRFQHGDSYCESFFLRRGEG